MSDDPIRQRLETSKQRARVWREWGYFALTALVGVVLIMSMLTFRATQQMVGATNAEIKTTVVEIRGIAADIRSQVALVDVARVNRRVDDVGDSLAELNRLITSVRGQSERLTSASVARINQLGENLASLQGVTDEAQRAIAKLTTATTTLVDKYGLTADEASKAIALASQQTGKSLESLAKQISDPRWGEAADKLVATTGEANATLVDFHKYMNETMAELPGIARDVHKTTTNISRYSRISIVVSIISRLAGAFIPGLLN